MNLASERGAELLTIAARMRIFIVLPTVMAFDVSAVVHHPARDARPAGL